MNERTSLADTALELLRSRQWAGPDTSPTFERFLMQAKSKSIGRVLRSRGSLFLLLLGGGALMAAAGISAGYYGLFRKVDGTAFVVHAEDNKDGTITLTYKDGRKETAHKLRQGPPPTDLPPGVFMLAAPVGGELLDANGNPVAVTHDLRSHEERFPEDKAAPGGGTVTPSGAAAGGGF